MKYSRQLLVLVLLLILSCNSKQVLNKIEGKQIPITDSLNGDSSIEQFIAPYRTRINKDLDSVIAYSVETYTKSDGELNTAIGNLMADVVYEQANPIFNRRTGKNIDFVLLNHGGIRSILSKGNVTKRTAFEMMPFENAVVVAELKGQQIKELINFLVENKRAHPISQLKLVLTEDYKLSEASIGGSAIDYNRIYNVATNDYLYNGGNGMDFFKKSLKLHILDYKIRNALIDYFLKVDTLNPVADDRFIIKSN